jgi:hypothetical protein
VNYPLRRTCREAAAIILAGEDRRLGFAERLALRVHFMVCAACPNFAQEVRTMRAGFAAWRSYRDDA